MQIKQATIFKVGGTTGNPNTKFRALGPQAWVWLHSFKTEVVLVDYIPYT